MLLREIVQKISKTAAAYLVGGIALIQLAPVFLNTFPPEDLIGLSQDSIMEILFILVAIGFPVTLVSAYFFTSNTTSSNKH